VGAHAYRALESCRRRGGVAAVKKIEAFIRHEAFEPIRSELLDRGFPSLSIRTGEAGEAVLQAHTEEEIAAGAAHEE